MANRLSLGRRKGSAGAVMTLGWMIGIAWLLEGLDFFYPRGSLTDSLLGLEPRTLPGLLRIPTMPFAHGGLGHLLGNTFPWIVLGGLTSWGERRHFLRTTVILVLISGLGTWLIGRQGVHIGASGLVYGYMGYVAGRAVYLRRPLMIFAGLVAVLLFSWMIFGLVPTGQAVSWEGHAAGLFGGIYLARYRSINGGIR